MATDYLTCGSCLREFPLQSITTFIQHKKLDCDDEEEHRDQQTELQCNYCPQGFMTAWALLVHAQITHNLKIFLENASKTLLSTKSDGTSSQKTSKIHQQSPLKSNDEAPNKQLEPRQSNIFKTSSNESIDAHKIVKETSINSSGSIKNVGSLINSNTSTDKYSGNVTIPANTMTPCLSSSSSVQQISVANAQMMPLKVVSQIGPSQSLGTQTFFLTQTSPLKSQEPFVPLQAVNISSSTSKQSLKTVSQPVPIQPKPSSSIPTVKLSTIQLPFKLTSQEQIRPSLQTQKLTTNLDLKLQYEDNMNSETLASTDGNNGASSSTSAVSEPDTDMLMDDSNEDECCSTQGCGVTVIPGSHESLKECCNAVVPKKRKRHMEQKHMPFAWGSSRYASRKLLNRSKVCTASKAASLLMMSRQPSSPGHIYIDVEPESLMSSDSNSNIDSASLSVVQSLSGPLTSSGNLMTSSETVGKQKSLIIQPGAVFSIPFTYTIPNPSQGPSTKSMSTSTAQSLVITTQTSSDAYMMNLATSPPKYETSPTSQAGTREAIRSSILARRLQRAENSEAEEKGNSEGKKPFQCEKCTMGFKQRIHLKKHMSKHTGIKPYKCGECDYSTVERSHLKVHIRIHTGEKPFKCTYCEYATAQNSTLKIHLKRHHGGKMFSCSSCQKQFTEEQQLLGHVTEHSDQSQATTTSKPSPSSWLPIATTSSSTNQTMSTSLESLAPANQITASESHVKETANQTTVTLSPTNILTNQPTVLCDMPTLEDLSCDTKCTTEIEEKEDIGPIITIPEQSDS